MSYRGAVHRIDIHVRHIPLLFLVLMPLGTRAETLVLYSSEDNAIYSGRDGFSNGQGCMPVRKLGEGGERRGLIRFDLAAIPTGSLVESATVTLFAEPVQDPRVSTVDLHRVAAAWGEGSSDADGDLCIRAGDGAVAAVGDATWRYRFYPDPDRIWSTPGGDHAAVASATRAVDSTAGEHTWSGAS